MIPLIQVLVALIIVAAATWLLNAYVPMTGGMRTIIRIVLMLIIVGMILWVINTYIPMAGSIKAILNIVVVIGTCVLILKAIGLWGEVTRLWRNVTNHRLSS